MEHGELVELFLHDLADRLRGGTIFTVLDLGCPDFIVVQWVHNAYELPEERTKYRVRIHTSAVEVEE